MNKFITILTVMCMGCAWSAAQESFKESSTTITQVKEDSKPRKETKEERKARKKREKELKAAADSADFKYATAALRKGYFVLTATRIDLGNMGYSENCLNETTNFVYQQCDEGVVQVAFNTSALGLNGIGGITCRGKVTNAKYREDNKGNAHYDYTVVGNNISAQISITVYAGSKAAKAHINPIHAGANYSCTLHGNLVPYKQD